MSDEDIKELLSQAVGLLRIMAKPQMLELKERFEASMLSTPKRREMWMAMDGTRTLAEIGRKVGTSGEAVRQFLVDVQERWPELIELKPSAGGNRPRRLI